MNHTRKLAIRRMDDINVQACGCDSLCLYYHKIFIFAVLERWLIYDCETERSFVYLFFIWTVSLY